MAYSKQNFQDGQILTAANLEKMENGIIAGQGAKNLLDNSDFSNPINSKGKTSYSTAGNEYTIDRWKTQYGTGLTVENGYINVIGNWQIYQTIKNPKDGVYTFAVEARINAIGDYTPNMDIGGKIETSFGTNIGEWKVHILQYDLSTITDETITLSIAARGGNSSGSISVRWAALYKGAYDISTLPPYVPKGKHVEMLNCGVSLAPHNLLDNSDFRNPINQRGIYDTTESENLRYTIDRWISYLTSIDVNQTGMLLSGQFGSGYNTIYQYVPLTPDGRIYTAALYYADGTVKCASGDFLTKAGGVGAEYGVLLEKDSDGKPYVQLYTYDGKRIIGAALYEGSYTADTLPSYVPKGKRVEMLNCGVSLQPRNLLDNSDFTNPVNQRCFSSTTSTSDSMGIDRWLFSVNSGGSLSLTADGLVCQNANLIQKIDSKLLDSSKEYTQVLWQTDGTPILPTKWIDFNYSSGVGRVVYYGATGTIAAAAIYEGSYTAETLPPYVPKGKHIEMLNCGVQLNPRNLLDNSDFTNYVNQRGGTSTAGVWDYCIDRWRAIGTAGQLVWHNSDHVALGALRGISQAIENKSRFVGKTYTIAAKDTGGALYITSGTYGGDDSHIWKETNGMELRLYSVPDDNNIYYSLKNLSSDTSNFIYLKWAALYEGSYTADTLPAYQPKGYTAELAECQRYYRTMPYPVIPCANNPAGTQVYGFLPFRMRIANSTVACDTLYFFKGDTTFSSVSNASATSYGAGTRIVFNLSQSVEGNLAGAIAGNGIALSADL